MELPKQHHRKHSKKKNKTLERLCLHRLLEYTRQKKKDGELHVGHFHFENERDFFFYLEKKTNKTSEVPRCCFSRLAGVADGSDSHPQKLILYLKKLFLSLQFVTSPSSFGTDTSSLHASTKTPLLIPESPVDEPQ